MLQLFKATVISSVSIITAMLIIYRFSGFSRAVFILDGGLTFLLTGGMRMAIRLLHQNHLLGKEKNGFEQLVSKKEKSRC